MLRNKDYELISIGGKDKPIAFNLNVQSELQEEFGAIADWAKKLDDGNTMALITTFRIMINEGIAIVNEDDGKTEKEITQRTAGRWLTSIGISGFKEKMSEMLGSDEEREATPIEQPRQD